MRPRPKIRTGNMTNEKAEQTEITFANKLNNITSESLGIEGYPGAYLDHILTHFNYYSSIYSYVIKLATEAIQKPVSELTVLDFGTGNGMLAMFAKQFGFKKVWASDISPDFLNAARKVSQAAKIHIDGFIEGDEQALLNWFSEEGVRPDIVLGTDVIEHIYNLDSFFAVLKKLNPQMVHVFTTASNPHNYFKVKELRKLQYKDEYVGYTGQEENISFHNAQGAESFLSQREKIIKSGFSNLPDDIVAQLAKATRGLVKRDIVSAVNNYLITAKLPQAPADPHLVCDPETGSWTERVSAINTYKELYKGNGFSFQYFNGFYNAKSGGGIKSISARLMNSVFCANRYWGKYFSPFIVFRGKGL
jgi:2-polyprenyl-3-methyl-5-hydroxy-6-metoxy-1,4-benzoquinol methylase